MTDRVVRKTFLALLEGLLSAVIVVMVLWFPALNAAAYLCFGGDGCGPAADDIRLYRVSVGVLAGVVLATFVVAAQRGARWAFAWHALITVVGVISAVAFVIPAVDWVDRFEEDPPPHGTPPSHVPCYSGPPNDCPGG